MPLDYFVPKFVQLEFILRGGSRGIYTWSMYKQATLKSLFLNDFHTINLEPIFIFRLIFPAVLHMISTNTIHQEQQAQQLGTIELQSHHSSVKLSISFDIMATKAISTKTLMVNFIPCWCSISVSTSSITTHNITSAPSVANKPFSKLVWLRSLLSISN